MQHPHQQVERKVGSVRPLIEALIVVGAYMLAVYRQVVCRPDCALQPCHALTYDNSRSTAAASVTPAEVMATKACWICSAGSSGSASNLRSIRCVLALSQYAVAKPVNVVAPYRHINEEMAPDFFRKFTGKTRPNNLISISVTISISASWFVGESVCRRIGLSASCPVTVGLWRSQRSRMVV